MKYKSLILVYILLLALMACHKESTSNPKATPPFITTTINRGPIVFPLANTDGFGPSTKPLSGTPYLFPVGITLKDSIITSLSSGALIFFYECLTDGPLPFYFTLRNSNSTPTPIIFPAGLVIPSTDTIVQGAIIVQPDTFVMPANSSYIVNLNAYCLNETRTFFSGRTYGSPMISTNYNLRPLIEILAKKQTINNDSNDVVQKAVWDIANTGQMTTTDIATLNTFP